jgi:hypothetical protein
MTHIKLLGVITTCGAPRWWSYVVGHPGKRTILRGMRALCGRKLPPAFHGPLPDGQINARKPRQISAPA